MTRVTREVQEQLRKAMRQQPDLTLAELQQKIQTGNGIKLSKFSV